MPVPSLAFLPLLALFLTLPAQAADWQYLTVPGDTLIGIGKQYLKNPADWPKVQAENQVEIPRKMPAGFRLRIPVSLLKVTPAPVTVTAVNGNVRVQGADKRFQPLAAGSQLNGGETVVTGPRSSVSYRFADGTTLTQQAASRLGFGRLSAYGKTGMIATELKLESGRLEARAAKQTQPAGGFQVKTPVAVAGLRGTAFRVSVTEDGRQMSNEVTEGIVAVAAKGQAVDVNAGFGTFTEAGKPPVKPRALLTAPNISAMPPRIQRLPLQFSKPPQEGSVAWRARVAGDEGFDSVLLDGVFTGPMAQWDEGLPDGSYYLRARGIDANGLEGLESVHAFEVDVHPLPPVPIAPALGERLYQHQADFTWTAVPDAGGYLLQVSPTPEFDNGVIERRLPPVVRHQETLPEGEWHWRVASLDETGQPHLFSPHRAFLVKPLPQPPTDSQSRAEDGKAHFAWSPVKGADGYGIEIGRNDQVVASKQAKDTAVSADLEPGKYLWRVRSQEADGQAGSWSGQYVVILPPAPPRDVRVDAGATPPTVSWQGQAPRYRMEVAATTDFSKPVLSLETELTRASLQEMLPGTYHLRVTALGEEGAVSPPSAPLAFTLERALPWWLPLCLIPLL
ncbi:MAG: FecR domain-containing protein [Pseudomonadota bacterium]